MNDMDLLGIHLYLHENTNIKVSIVDLHKPYLIIPTIITPFVSVLQDHV